MPATFHTGSTPIDGIFVTPALRGLRGGYLGFEDGVPNDGHRLLWYDLPYELVFGHTPPAIVRPAARRLKSKIPKIANAYREHYEKCLRKHNLNERVYALQERATVPLTQADAAEYEAIDKF